MRFEIGHEYPEVLDWVKTAKIAFSLNLKDDLTLLPCCHSNYQYFAISLISESEF